MENPFEGIENQLTRIERLLESGKESKPKEKRIVGFKEFVNYSGFNTQTLYIKLHKGKVIAGAFKLPGCKCWNFDLNIWDRHLREAQENQYKEG